MKKESPQFQALPMAARLWILAVVSAGALALAWSIPHGHLDRPELFGALLVLALVMSSAKVDLRIGSSHSNLSLAHTVTFWSLLALGRAETMCIAAVGAWAQCTLRVPGRNPTHRTLFSIASLVLTVWLVALVLEAASGHDGGVFGILLRAIAIAAPLYFLFNTVLIGAAVALATGQSFPGVWRRNFLWSAPSYLAGALLAAMAAITTAQGWSAWIFLLAVPLYLVFRSYHGFVARLREEQNETRRAMDVQLATIEALALAIEAKAGCSPEHIQSIQRLAVLLAEAAGLSDGEVQAVRTAALLHDVGNLAVPEHILAKPEALTPEEFERVKIHPRVGAEILGDIPFGVPVAELVLSHHERWDGTGYPAGLRAEQIPIGARILAIADCYSTIRSHRPYRPARSHEQAAALLRATASTSLDPTLVELFLARLQARPTLTLDADSASAGTWVEGEGSMALEDIAEAHREEQILYEIAQSLGSRLDISDAMMLIAEKVSPLVPFVTCALFLGDETKGYVCRYAHGPGAEALMRRTAASSSDIALRLPSCADGRDSDGGEIAAVLPCPLIVEGRTIGVLALYHTVAGFFTDDHRRVLGRVSDQAAAVIINSARFEQTRHESQTDPLTALPNRRSLAEQFEAGLSRTQRLGGSIALIVLDLDRLKEINDTFGHEAGDRAIRTVASALRSSVRSYDLCARFAGDEFVIVLWDCEPGQEAHRMFEFQQAVAARSFEPNPGIRVALSISAGMARFGEDGRTFEELLAVADSRMYHDKATHRSRGAQRSSSVAGVVGVGDTA